MRSRQHRDSLTHPHPFRRHIYPYPPVVTAHLYASAKAARSAGSPPRPARDVECSEAQRAQHLLGHGGGEGAMREGIKGRRTRRVDGAKELEDSTVLKAQQTNEHVLSSSARVSAFVVKS